MKIPAKTRSRKKETKQMLTDRLTLVTEIEMCNVIIFNCHLKRMKMCNRVE